MCLLQGFRFTFFAKLMLSVSLPVKPNDVIDYESDGCLEDGEPMLATDPRTLSRKDDAIVMSLRSRRRRWASAGLTLILITAVGALLIVRSRHSVGQTPIDKRDVQRKFGDWVVDMLWNKHDPYKFRCPLPFGLMATDWDIFKANGYKPLNNTKYSAHYGPVEIQTKDGQFHMGLDKSAGHCCRYYNWSWWPYVYPECKSYSSCSNCWKASPVSQLDEGGGFFSRPLLSPLAGVAWAASTNVYEDHLDQQLPGLGLSQKDTTKMLVTMSTGKRLHKTNVCPKLTSLEQTTFEYEALSLRVRASRSAKDRLAIIAFRGTLPSEMMNWWVDLDTKVTKFNLGGTTHEGPFTQVHEGYLNALRTLLKNLRHWVDGDIFGVGQIPADWTLLFTGHSMGGAFAILAATMVFVEGWNRVPDAVITFGNPRVADKVLSDWWQDKKLCDRLLRVNVYNDGVHLVPFNKQSPSYKDIQRCNADLGDCLAAQPSSDLQSLWVPVCPSSEFLVPGAVKGMNELFQDFNWYGASLAHTLSQCLFGYAYGIFNNGIVDRDAYCGLSQDICPDFTCSTVEDLKGKQCAGLTEQPDIKEASDCKEQCCNDVSCEIWLWVNTHGDPTLSDKAAFQVCWLGQSDNCKDWMVGADEVLEGGRIK